MSTDFQTRSGQEGRRFEDFCARLLRGSGFTILEEHFELAELGVDVDFVIENRRGQRFYVECKGGKRGRPGAQRTDNVRKAVATGALLRLGDTDAPPLLLMVTRNAKKALRSDRLIEAAMKYGAIHDVIATDEEERADLAKLDVLANLEPDQWPVRRQEDDAPYHWPEDGSE